MKRMIQIGKTIECGHCNPEKYGVGLDEVQAVFPDYQCDCQCHAPTPSTDTRCCERCSNLENGDIVETNKEGKCLKCGSVIAVAKPEPKEWEKEGKRADHFTPDSYVYGISQVHDIVAKEVENERERMYEAAKKEFGDSLVLGAFKAVLDSLRLHTLK